MARPWSIRTISHRKYLAILGSLFAIIWIALAIKPWYREDWLLENALVILFVVLIAMFHKRWIFSRLSYTLIFFFLCFHIIGAHYTYARTPYDDWFRSVFGTTFNELVSWERNNYDRVVHFLYGLLLAYPVREIFLRIARVRGFWGYFLPMDLMMSSSACFELVEWGVAELFGGGLGAAYLGTQGDIWDAHKDMALASLGALTAMSITLLVNYHLRRDFAQEWAQSLRVKRKQPLGEDEIVRLLKREQ
jgi:putative membrane protein